mgnify:CR=1 FL=1
MEYKQKHYDQVAIELDENNLNLGLWTRAIAETNRGLSKELMEIDWSKLIPMSLSAIAACVSIAYAAKSKSMQTRLIENKSEIEQLSSLIETLKVASAITKYPHDYDDESFSSGIELDDVPSRVAKLMQNGKIYAELNKPEWDLPITNIDNKIEQLSRIRKELM